MIRLDNVTKIYGKGDAKCTALSRICLTLPEKGLVFIEGRSGSGKTTLLNIIAGFDSPTSGTVQTEYGKNFCAMIFQDFQLIDMLTVRQNLELVQDIMPQAKTDIESLAQKYGLGELLHKYPNQISGGQKQRVAIVRAVLENRPVIACDEPTGNLDEENAVEIARLLASEARDRLVLVVSHDKELFAPLCNHHICLKNGAIDFDSASESENERNCEDRQDNRTAIQENGANDNPVRIGVCSQIALSYRFFRKSLTKNILLALALLLSFVVLLSALNGLFNYEGYVTKNVHRLYGEKIEFALQNATYADEYDCMTESDYAYAAKKGKIEAQFVDAPISEYANGEKVCAAERIYIADRCARKMLYGVPETAGNTVLLSDYLAERIAAARGTDIPALIGTPVLWGVTLGGVYVTKYSENKAADVSEETLAREYKTAYISMQTALMYNAESDLVYTASGGRIQSPAITVCREPYAGFVEYGEAGTLAENEIALSVGLAAEYTSELSSLVGQTVQITFANVRNALTKEPYHEITLTRKVKYIIRGAGAAVLSDADRTSVLTVRGNRLFGDKTWGVRMTSCSKHGVQSLIAHGFTCYSRFDAQIAAGFSWQRTLSYIELAIGMALLLVSVFMLCNHVSALVEKEKRALGVLASFGVRMRHTVLMYLAGTFIAVFICLALAAVTEFAVVAGINGIMTKAGITAIKTFFYEPLAAVCLIGIFAIVIAVLYARVSHKLSKKQIVDVIYER